MNIQELSSVSPEVFTKFWKDEFDDVILEIWRDKGGWVGCIFVFMFEELLGEEKYKEFLDYANTNLIVNHVSGRQIIEFNYNDIGNYAIRRLQEKFKIDTNKDRPKKIKKCALCETNFDAVRVTPSLTSVHSDNLEVCQPCHAKAFNWYHSTSIIKSKSEMSNDLAKLSEILGGLIPPREFKKPTYIRPYLNKQNHVEGIRLLQTMCHPSIYKKEFGSYFKAIISAGLLEDDVRRMGRGTMCVAEDGHTCLSVAEKNIDDWLFKNNIKHEKEPAYPKNQNLNPDNSLRADWKVNNVFIEYFGLKGNKDYDKKILLKRELANILKLNLIEIYIDDLSSLEGKLKVFTS